jgi:hypothetical protein
MPVESWNEEAKRSHDHDEEEDSWMSPEQLAQCARADVADTFGSPVPTRMVSNGEYFPHPQTEKQKRVEARIQELADSASKKLGVSRRKFLASTGGMAAAFLAMNEVFGRLFKVSPVEMFEAEAYAAEAAPRNLFVFDDQTHMVRSSRTAGGALRDIARGVHTAFNPDDDPDELGRVNFPWNPEPLPNAPENFHLVQYIKDMYFNSQVTVAVLSNVTPGTVIVPGEQVPRAPKNIPESLAGAILTTGQTVAVRNFVNRISGSTRLLAHGLFYPGKGNLEYMQFQIDTYGPDSWKGYNINRAAKVDFDPQSDMRRWRHDDEAVAYPTFQLITDNKEQLRKYPGFWNICVHKGLSTNAGPEAELGHPSDMPKAARDWPHLNFITYHSCIRPGFWVLNALNDVGSGRTREGVPDILWTTEYAQLVAPFPNVYAEIGTTWASTVVTFPTVAAHIMGQLMKYMGPDRIVFGSDSLWYGSPQWQIEAMWRFEIPEEMRQQYGYPELTQAAKRKILGLNSARLYKLPGAAEPASRGVYKPVPADYEQRIPVELKTLLEFPGYAQDNLSTAKTEYVAMGPELSNTRYGWIRTKA